MSFMEKVARIRAELLGEGCEMPAVQVVAAALPPPESAGEPGGSGDS